MPTYTLTDLGVVQITGGGAKDINESGQVALNLDGTGYVWTNGVLSPPGGFPNNNVPFAINDLGQTVSLYNERTTVFNGTTWSIITGQGTSGYDINNSGQIVGDYYRADLLRYRGIFLANPGTYELPAFTPTGESKGNAINNAGLIVGQADNLPARWVNQVIQQLDLPTGMSRGTAIDVNQLGQAVGNTSDGSSSNIQATLWNGTTATLLGTLGSYPISAANGINDVGQVVGYVESFLGDYNPRAFLYQDGTMYNLTMLVNKPGWNLEQAYAINNDGDIVGTARFNNVRHAYLLRSVPEVHSIFLMGGLALVGLVVIRRRLVSRS